MGSSSSTQQKSAKGTRNAAGSREKETTKLPGSSTPPKGPPRSVLRKGSQANQNKENVSQSSSEKAADKGHTNGIQNKKIVSHNTSEKTIEKDRANDSGADKDASSKRASVTDTNNKRVSMRPKSSKRPETRKDLVRRMERGLEDEDDVDAILGLDRMKSKMVLRRERSRMRDELGDFGDRKQSLHRFQNATRKISQYDKDSLGSADDVCRGNVNIECPPRAKIVRIFTSSTFTDTMHERNTLMKEAYPKVKAYCQEHGYDFQVVDMRWGIRDQATDDNMGTDICLQELRLCQKLSIGVNFVTLMSHKYGYSDFPRCIAADEFEKMIKEISDPELLALFKKWYNKDMNACPPAYVVSAISAHLPDFLSTDKEKKEVAKKQWWMESEKIQAALEEIAAKVFDAKTARKYTRSVSESEIQMGLLQTADPASHCLWLKRTIENIDDQEPNYRLSRYTECSYNNAEGKVQKSKQMLSDLKKGMNKVLPAENILEYSVKWNKEEGLDPDKELSHAQYLSKLSKDFVRVLCTMVDTAIKKQTQTEDRLKQEILQHVKFCQEKCFTFHGREDVLKKVKAFIEGFSSEPLVLFAESGSGKTSVMAAIARDMWAWTKQKATVILRFIGTSPGSSNLHDLLANVTAQIKRAYGETNNVSQDLRTLIEEFNSSLLLASTGQPLVIIFDSLDMLDPSHNARQIQWLPVKLRPNVKIILSTLPGTQYEAFPVLQASIKAKENIIEIPSLPANDVSIILDKWLSLKNRTLTNDQKAIVISAFQKCSIPLFLKLAVDKATSWTSYIPRDQAVLESTVRASIDSLFQRLEKVHGYLFVSRSLGYLSAARSGLTETELEDILSCDDDVLNDVYMYWTPPIRRLPPLLLIRLRTDLSQYLVDRGADNVRVMNWYHRQFQEAATNRYCGKDNVRQLLHTGLADFFSGKWAQGKEKPFSCGKGGNGSADRHVSAQPNKYGSAYNLRKLNNLPYHRCYSNQLDKLKEECLSNFEFLLDKVCATSLWQIMEDFALTQSLFPSDEYLAKVSEVLNLSQHAVFYDPRQLASQFVGRLPKTKVTESFLRQCQRYPSPTLMADKCILTQPGGQLKYCMAGHHGDILSLDLTMDSTLALTCSDDETIRIWNTNTGMQVKSLDGLGKVTRAVFCNHDNFILLAMNNKTSVKMVKTGERVYDIPEVTDDSPSCVAGEGKTKLVAFTDSTVYVYDIKDGSMLTKVACSDNIQFKFPGFAVGSKNYVAVTTWDQVSFTVLDLGKNTLSPLFRGFEPFEDPDGEEIQYEVDEMTLTADEKFLVYSNVYTNDIVFLDFCNKSKHHIIKGDPNDYIRSLRCSPDNKYLYLVKATFINVIDMATKKVVEELEHTVDVVNVITNDMRTVVTTAEDSNVRVWDRTKKVQKLSKDPGITAFKIRMITLHENSRYLIGFGFKNKDRDSQFLFVYDIIGNCTVRERLLDSSILQFEMLNDKELLVLNDIERKLRIINIDTMTVTKEFMGYLPNSQWNFKVIDSKNEHCDTFMKEHCDTFTKSITDMTFDDVWHKSAREVVCLSRGRKNAKLYDINTGKNVAILSTGHNVHLDGFTVDEDGTVLATWCSVSKQIFLFDLKRRKLSRTLKQARFCCSQGNVAFTPDGKLLLFKVEGPPPGSVADTIEDEIFYEVWSVDKGSHVSSLVDLEYYHKYHNINGNNKFGHASAADTMEILDNHKAIVAHDDFMMRVYDIQKGSILHRLSGHSTSIEIVYRPDSPYILTYGSWTEENSMRVWNKWDFSCVTSYSLDKPVTLLNWSSDGKFLLATTGKPAEMVTWKFNNFMPDLAVNTADYTDMLQGIDIQGYFELIPEDDDLATDPNDPDQEMPSDDSDDDDDDDFM